ncbi:MAG: GxxExxY protein [Prochloron sp. SP5CPC1]|nr:GxxExxY protein [Candidatus Paraprochloron terpiosi SP5CPC1]
MRSINEITERILGCSFTVSNGLGAGFLEKVYENALTHELRKIGLAVEQQYKIEVWYDDIIVGNYTADLLVEKLVLVELKSVDASVFFSSDPANNDTVEHFYADLEMYTYPYSSAFICVYLRFI